MIDAHCHFEQKDYDIDREEVILACKKELRAVVNSCCHFNDYVLGMKMRRQHPDFLFLALGLHPSYIKELSEGEKDNACGYIMKHAEEICAIGEIGLDYYWVKEEAWQKKQHELFTSMIRLAEKLHLPMVVHCRDAFDDAIGILEQENAKRVLLHHFDSHQEAHIRSVIDNGWKISIGPNIKTSKTPRRLARDMPLHGILLETDAPWFGFGRRNTPLSVRSVAEQIAEIKKISFEEVWAETARNAVSVFKLPIKI